VERDVKALTALMMALMAGLLLAMAGGLLFDVILTEPRLYP
jgi:hypothetical protein